MVNSMMPKMIKVIRGDGDEINFVWAPTWFYQWVGARDFQNLIKSLFVEFVTPVSEGKLCVQEIFKFPLGGGTKWCYPIHRK